MDAIITSTDLANKTGTILDACVSEGRSQVVVRNSRPVAAVIPYETYELLKRDMEYWIDIKDSIIRGYADSTEGRVRAASDVFAEQRMKRGLEHA